MSRTIAIPATKWLECLGMVLAISTELLRQKPARLEDMGFWMQ
jgi:hypothetical protein